MTEDERTDFDHLESLVESARGESVTIETLVGPDGHSRSAINVLAGDETLHHLLQGRILDYENAVNDSAERERSRTRKMARSPFEIVSLLTDRRLALVVERDGTDDVIDVPYSNCLSVSLETMGADNKRLVVRTDAHTYYADASLSPIEHCEAAVSFLTDRIEANRDRGAGDEPVPETDDVRDFGRDIDGTDGDPKARSETNASTAPLDPLDALEKLADLRDRGIVTDAEFERKKRELLDRL